MAALAAASDRFFVATVAQRLVGTGLAAAKIDFLALARAVFERDKRAAFMRAVTKRLALAFAAGAPEVVFPALDLDCKWRVGGANWCVHGNIFPGEC